MTDPTPSPLPAAVRHELCAAAAAFLDGLDDDRRRRAQYPLDGPARRDWHYFPRLDQPGLRLAEMDGPQREVARRLLRTALSERGLAKAEAIMRLETQVRRMEEESVYHPDNYSFAVFGQPSADAPWGWRIDGHHLSLTMVATPDGDLTVTPHFMGANPAEVHGGDLDGTRPLAEEMDRAFGLLDGLDQDERARAVIADRSMGDILTGPGRESALATPEGLAAEHLSEARRDGLMRLVEAYAHRLRPDLAERELARVRQAGVERLHFAWAGSLQPGRPHYYRIHGPTLLIEYDCTQDDANHVHTVWHDPTGRDFGDDPLRRHYDHGHGDPHHGHGH